MYLSLQMLISEPSTLFGKVNIVGIGKKLRVKAKKGNDECVCVCVLKVLLFYLSI